MIGRRAAGRGGLGMVVDMSEGVPVYRWQDTQPPRLRDTIAAPRSSVAKTAPMTHLASVAGVPSVPTLSADKSASTASLLSGSVGQSPARLAPSRQIKSSHRSASQHHPSVASWVDEVTKVASVPEQPPLLQPSSRMPFVRVTVSAGPNMNSRPVARKATPVRSSVPPLQVKTHPSVATRPPTAVTAPDMKLPSHSSASSSASWSTTPSMRIPADATHGRVNRTEVFDAPFAHHLQPALVAIRTGNPSPHPGLRAGHYLPPRAHNTFPPFPPFPAFPAFPTFPAFPAFPAFPQVSCVLPVGTTASHTDPLAEMVDACPFLLSMALQFPAFPQVRPLSVAVIRLS
jgi:hypothetical protein